MSELEAPYNASGKPEDPINVDPRQFFIKLGSRPMFSPYKFALYLNEAYGPIKRIRGGQIAPLPWPALKRVATLILKDQFSKSKIDETFWCLASLIYRQPQPDDPNDHEYWKELLALTIPDPERRKEFCVFCGEQLIDCDAPFLNKTRLQSESDAL
ncbi:MAG: hypothetical protein NT047_00680 [Deltaproteobacteria bacterium]|nr:hypothetical protein [Deltaproteobacteria bacterium]